MELIKLIDEIKSKGVIELAKTLNPKPALNIGEQKPVHCCVVKGERPTTNFSKIFHEWTSAAFWHNIFSPCRLQR